MLLFSLGFIALPTAVLAVMVSVRGAVVLALLFLLALVITSPFPFVTAVVRVVITIDGPGNGGDDLCSMLGFVARN